MIVVMPNGSPQGPRPGTVIAGTIVKRADADKNGIVSREVEQKKVSHLWHIDSGAHTWPVWRNDLYLLAQRLFRDGRPDSK